MTCVLSRIARVRIQNDKAETSNLKKKKTEERVLERVKWDAENNEEEKNTKASKEPLGWSRENPLRHVTRLGSVGNEFSSHYCLIGFSLV